MENKQERILAYTLSISIDEQALDRVAGGSGGRVVLPTIQLTGEYKSVDTVFDAPHE